MSPLTLGSWDVRESCQTLRMMLAYAHVDYEMTHYSATKTEDGYQKDPSVMIDKALGLKFQKLPYLIDGDVNFSYLPAVTRYISEKFGLHGKTHKERAIADMLSTYLFDVYNTLNMIVYMDEAQSLACKDLFLKEGLMYTKSGNEFLSEIEKFMNGKKWAVGEYITYADFELAEALHVLCKLYNEDVLDDYQTLKAFHKRFFEIPEIMDCENKYRNLPIYNKWAAFGSSTEAS